MIKRLFPCALLALGLAGCGSSSKTDPAPEPTVTLPTLSAASSSVVLGDEKSPSVGQYFTASDGTRLLIVSDATALATAIYRADTSGKWQRVPKLASDVSISFLRSDALTLNAIDLSALAGNYTTAVQGMATVFVLADDGKISAAAGATCKLSGTVGGDVAQGVRKLSLSSSGCTGLPASLQGYLIADADYAPAKLRLVLDNGSAISELWAYREG